MTRKTNPRLISLKEFLRAAGDPELDEFDTLRLLAGALELISPEVISAVFEYNILCKSDKWLTSEIKKAGFTL